MSSCSNDVKKSTEKESAEDLPLKRINEKAPLVPLPNGQRSPTTRTQRLGPLISLTPMERRLIIGASRVGLTFADGLLLSSTAANPVLTVAFIAYESFRAVSDYRHGELNALGYRTSLTDVALRVGKEVGTAAVGVAIGHAVGTLVGLSAIPVAGQIAVTAALSVTLGICVGTLLTRYADRMFVRLQLQSQYGYLANEQKARKRFERLLELEHDLSSFEACRTVQHYRDFRVACGWESATDVDDYRASANIFMMPVSFQHFAIVQLQRKWGFLNERSECKKVYKALMLLHHPDKGGNSEMAAQLNHDFEVYAFCQGWEEECPSIYKSAGDGSNSSETEVVLKKKKNIVVDFLRSLFRHTSNSVIEAEDLRQYGLLALESGTPGELHRLDELETIDFVEEVDNNAPEFGTSASVKQQSVSRVLGSIKNCYQLATEAITFAGLVELYKQPGKWSQLKSDIFLFNRMQVFLYLSEVLNGNATEFNHEHSCCGFQWHTGEEAIVKREELREAIISLCFPGNVASRLLEALELWKTAKSLADSFFKQCAGIAAGTIEQNEGTGQTLDTLLSIQKALQELAKKSTESWKLPEALVEESLDVHFVGEIKALGLTASSALAGAHAKNIHSKLRKTCEEFFKSRRRKIETLTTLLNEVHELRSHLETAKKKGDFSAVESLQLCHDDYMRQLILVHHVFGELDAAINELYDAYTMHLPEQVSILKTFPSSCAQGIYEDFELSRYVKYERERTLMNYMNIEVGPQNAMDPTRKPTHRENSQDVECVNEAGIVKFALIRAQFVDPVNGTVTPCWLKRYTFPRIEETGDDDVAKHTQQKNLMALFRHIVDEEISVSESCASHRLSAVTDVFCDECTRQLFFHIPRGGTQIRFGSTHDVTKRITRLGLRWLHDALQSIIELHSCQLVHGSIHISNFTYDDFGNTTLGFFSSVVRDRKRDALTPMDDAVDFGASLHAEVLPYLPGYTSAISPVHPSPTLVESRSDGTFPSSSPQPKEEIFRVFKEVADRLIGKEEPRWTLLDARTFVRRFLEFSLDSDERNFLFTKEVSYPAYWATLKSSIPVSLVVDHRVLMQVPEGATVLLNRNIHLWGTYWKCRRKMVQKRGGSLFSVPMALRNVTPFLPCSDDCEVNERFLWCACNNEEEAWKICLEGLTVSHKRLNLAPPWRNKSYTRKTRTVMWGIVFRVSLGTVVASDQHITPSPQGETENESSVLSLVNELERLAEHKCLLLVKDVNASVALDSWEVNVPSPNARCYPEYVVYQPQL